MGFFWDGVLGVDIRMKKVRGRVCKGGEGHGRLRKNIFAVQPSAPSSSSLFFLQSAHSFVFPTSHSFTCTHSALFIQLWHHYPMAEIRGIVAASGSLCLPLVAAAALKINQPYRAYRAGAQLRLRLLAWNCPKLDGFLPSQSSLHVPVTLAGKNRFSPPEY